MSGPSVARVIHRCPNIHEELSFTLALLVDAPPEIWFAWITGDEDLVYDYLDELDELDD